MRQKGRGLLSPKPAAFAPAIKELNRMDAEAAPRWN